MMTERENIEDDLQPSLFDDKELQINEEVLTEEEQDLLNQQIEVQIDYIKDFMKTNSVSTEEIIDEAFKYKHQIFSGKKIPLIIKEIIRKNNLSPIQVSHLDLTQKEKIRLVIEYYSNECSIDFLCRFLFCKKSIIYKWIKENKKEILEKKIKFLQTKISEFNELQFFITPEMKIKHFDYEIEELNRNINNFNDPQLLKLTLSELKEKYAPNRLNISNYIRENFQLDINEQNQNQKQYDRYVKDLEKCKNELKEINEKQNDKTKNICTSATNIPNDIIINDFYDLLTYYDNLELFAERQTKKSHSLRLTPKITDSKIKLNLLKTNTKNLTLQMDKPNKNINMAYMRDIFVIAMQQLATMDKELLTTDNLRLNPVTINISTINYFENSNYKNLRKVQEMSKDEYIEFLGSLAIFGKSEIYDGKGKNKKLLLASETEEIQKKFIPMFKSTGYQNNNIELMLNDVFPWQFFTLKYFTMLPDNYLQLSENAKTLLLYLCSQARIKKQTSFKLYYSDLQLLLNLKSYEEDKNHATERIIKPIQKTIEEINENNFYFICIDESIEPNRTPKEILETGYITVKCKNELKALIDNVNDSKQKKEKRT